MPANPPVTHSDVTGRSAECRRIRSEGRGERSEGRGAGGREQGESWAMRLREEEK
jgi:hypothetical protein